MLNHLNVLTRLLSKSLLTCLRYKFTPLVRSMYTGDFKENHILCTNAKLLWEYNLTKH